MGGCCSDNSADSARRAKQQGHVQQRQQRRQIPNWRLIQSRVPAGRSLKHRTQRADIFDEILGNTFEQSRNTETNESQGVVSLEQLVDRLPSVLDMPAGYEDETIEAIRLAFAAVTTKKGGVLKTAMLNKKSAAKKRQPRAGSKPKRTGSSSGSNVNDDAAATSGREEGAAATEAGDNNNNSATPAAAAAADAGALANDDEPPVVCADPAESDDGNNSEAASSTMSQPAAAAAAAEQEKEKAAEAAAAAPVAVTGLDEDMFWRFCCWLNVFFGVWSTFSFNGDADHRPMSKVELVEFDEPNGKLAKWLTETSATAPCGSIEELYEGALRFLNEAPDNNNNNDNDAHAENPLKAAPRNRGAKVTFREIALFVLDCQFDKLVYEPTQLK